MGECPAEEIDFLCPEEEEVGSPIYRLAESSLHFTCCFVVRMCVGERVNQCFRV